MSNWKKVLLTIVYVICFSGLVYGGVISVIHFTTPTINEQVSILETENKQLNEDLIEVNNNLVLCRAELEQSNADKKSLQTEIDNKDVLISQKNEEIENLTSSRDTWQGTAEEYQSKLSAMTTERDNLVAERDSLSTQLAEKEDEIKRLNTQILNLQNEVTRLTGLLADYEQIANETFAVDFYDEDGVTLVATHAVKKNEKLISSKIPTMESTDKRVFLGFSKDKVNVCNIAEEVVTGNVSYYALYEHRCAVNFEFNGTSVENTYIKQGTCATAPDYSVDNKYNVLGWSIDGVNVVDVSTIEINEDTTFMLLTELKIDGVYKYKITNFEATHPEGTFEISNGEVVSFVNLLDSKGQGGNTTFIKQEENTFRFDMRWGSSCKIIVDFIFNVETSEWAYNSVEFIDLMGGGVEAFTVTCVEPLDINGTYSFQAAWRYSATVDCSFTIENGAVTSSFDSGNYTIKNASLVFAYDQLGIFFDIYNTDGSSIVQTLYGRLTWNTDTQTWTWKNLGSSVSQGYAVYVVMK